ncbi:hypothetical protein XI25_11105 [Paenibacillus sp. DMB20]|nr:hypothetical protein XI25_11105 [Paenibacillus sp. DMB20]
MLNFILQQEPSDWFRAVLFFAELLSPFAAGKYFFWLPVPLLFLQGDKTSIPPLMRIFWFYTAKEGIICISL